LTDAQQASTLRNYLQVTRRRRWLILAVVVLVPLFAVFFSLRQEKLYEASAQVLVRSGFDGSQPAERVLQTQADIATGSPEVAERVRDVLELPTAPGIDVTPKTDSNILIFSSTEPDPRLAARVASEYARQFRDFQRELATADITRQLREVEAEITRLEASRRFNRAPYESLLEERRELRALLALETSRAFLVRPANEGVQVQPKPVRNGVLGLVLGIILGLGLAFLRDALDTRVRSTDEIAERLGVPLLARVPEPPRRLRRDDRLVMLNDPDGVDAEAFRILRANVEFVRIGRDARTLMVTSAVEGEGKSTTAANLAVALARAGHRVALVDLDLRRPSLHKFFDLYGPGITEVAIGSATLEEALAPIPLVWPNPKSWNGDRGELRPFPASSASRPLREVEGMLEVLPAGPMPPNVDEVLASHAVAGILEEIRKRADIVLVDSPPLVIGDAMALSAAVEGVIIVTRVNTSRRPMLTELRRVLDAIPAQKVGFVATGTSGESHRKYVGYHYRSTPRPRDPVA
jgi:succinoglycan biosynthesis transport protein ExoP